MRVNFKYKNGRERMMSRRDANILQKLGRGTYMTRDMRAQPAAPSTEEDQELSALRAEYQAVVGKRPFHGWGLDTLREKIAEARQGGG